MSFIMKMMNWPVTEEVVKEVVEKQVQNYSRLFGPERPKSLGFASTPRPRFMSESSTSSDSEMELWLDSDMDRWSPLEQEMPNGWPPLDVMSISSDDYDYPDLDASDSKNEDLLDDFMAGMLSFLDE